MAFDRPIEQLTLREMFTNAERLTSELTEHLERGFLPKIHGLGKLVRPPAELDPDEVVEDLTVRNHTAQVLDSEKFMAELFEKTERYLQAIDHAVGRILNDG